MTDTMKRFKFEERLKIIVGGYCYAQDGGNGGYEFGDIVKHIDESIHQARAEERSKLLLELLQVFNDYDVPLTMTAEQVRDILEAYLTKKD